MWQYKFQMAQVITQCRSSNPTSCSKVTFRRLAVGLCGLCRASLTWLVMDLYESPFRLIALDNMSSVLLLISLISQQCFMNHLRLQSWLYGNHPWFVRFQSFCQCLKHPIRCPRSLGLLLVWNRWNRLWGVRGSWWWWVRLLADGEDGVWSTLGGFTKVPQGHHETFETCPIQNKWRRWNWFTWPFMVHPKKRRRKSVTGIPAPPQFQQHPHVHLKFWGLKPMTLAEETIKALRWLWRLWSEMIHADSAYKKH